MNQANVISADDKMLNQIFQMFFQNTMRPPLKKIIQSTVSTYTYIYPCTNLKQIMSRLVSLDKLMEIIHMEII